MIATYTNAKHNNKSATLQVQRNKMKIFLLTVLAACIYLATGPTDAGLAEQEGHYFEQRPRLGHFKEVPFIDLYKHYAAAFKQPLFPETPQENNIFYLPSGDECMVFFRKFRIDRYVLSDIDELIVLDACLGYLYESTYHESDSEASENVRSSLEGFITDSKLRELYDGTKINELSAEAKECVGNLLLQAVQAKAQFSQVVCNNEWLNLFNEFAECQRKDVPSDFRQFDAYGVIIYDLVKSRANECFHNEINALNIAIRTKYVNNPFERVENILKSPFSSIRSQAKTRIWPKKITELLSAFQGTTKEINLREINGIIRGVGEDHPNFKQRLLNNMAKYADYVIAPKLNSKSTRRDPTGEARYKHLVDKLCNFFRQSDTQGFYDYSTPFVRMVKMLHYPEIFDISQDYFTERVLRHSFESGPLYLSVSSCNILTFTEAAFERKPQNGKLHYKVAFKPDLTDMVQWPDAGFY